MVDPSQEMLLQAHAHVQNLVRGAVADARAAAHQALEGPSFEALLELQQSARPQFEQAMLDLRQSGLRVVEVECIKRAVREEAKRRRLEAQSTSGPQGPTYFTQAGGIWWNRQTKDGTVPTRLTNFTAEIVEEIRYDDGSGESQSRWGVEVTLEERVSRCEITPTQFLAMNWPAEAIGPRAVVVAGLGAKDHARAAIQSMSAPASQRTVYGHLGWREIGGQHVFLHAGGAIGCAGPVVGILVRPGPGLDRYSLSRPPDDPSAALRASLSLLEVAPDEVSVPLLAAVFKAVLPSTDFSIHLTGPTGTGKTELCALTQQHFGPSMDARHLPGSWTSTDNALEAAAFLAKDVIFGVDDFAPCGSAHDVLRQHQKADRVLRGAGNSSGRARMSRDCQPRPSRAPRGLIVSTGEDTPAGHSLRARMLIVEVGPESVDWTKLGHLQGVAQAGLLAQALAGFVSWYAERKPAGDHLYSQLTQKFTAEFEGPHKRTVPMLAKLLAALAFFLQFGREAGILTKVEVNTYLNRGRDALRRLGQAQADALAGESPAESFLSHLRAGFAAGAIHLQPLALPALAPDGGVRADDLYGAWGWIAGEPSGEPVGWLNEERGLVLLQPEQAFRAAQKLARDAGSALPIGKRTLWKRLLQARLVVDPEPGRSTRLERVAGKVQRVLVLSARSFYPDSFI